jgi:hypothetical protein
VLGCKGIGFKAHSLLTLLLQSLLITWSRPIFRLDDRPSALSGKKAIRPLLSDAKFCTTIGLLKLLQRMIYNLKVNNHGVQPEQDRENLLEFLDRHYRLQLQQKTNGKD